MISLVEKDFSLLFLEGLRICPVNLDLFFVVHTGRTMGRNIFCFSSVGQANGKAVKGWPRVVCDTGDLYCAKKRDPIIFCSKTQFFLASLLQSQELHDSFGNSFFSRQNEFHILDMMPRGNFQDIWPEFISWVFS